MAGSRSSIALLLGALGLGGCAFPGLPPASTVGEVEAVYREIAPDLFVADTLLGPAEPGESWVRVAIASADEAAPSVMASVPVTMTVVAGDAVALRMNVAGPAGSPQPGGRARVVGRVVEGSESGLPPHLASKGSGRYLSQATDPVP